MRNLTLLLFTTIALIASAEPNLKWLNYSHNFGLFKEEDGLVYCAFKAINTGNEPVVIIDARANCGCTQPTYPREPIAPGDTLLLLADKSRGIALPPPEECQKIQNEIFRRINE